ncbi:MAG: hypothetical protein NZP34_14335 [Caldilineales bacterium]|nr:hypothetical protein [Caldilineales bacterium]
MTRFATLRLRQTEFLWGSRTYIMGILNLTPDSFSGDGLLNQADFVADLEQRGRRRPARAVDAGIQHGLGVGVEVGVDVAGLEVVGIRNLRPPIWKGARKHHRPGQQAEDKR